MELKRRILPLMEDARDVHLSCLIMDIEDQKSNRSPWTTSLIDESRVHGRESEKERLVQLLLEAESNKDVKVISILGAGGSGKTTLAQCVYNDYRVKQYFDVRKWVCVSESFELEMIFTTLLEDANGRIYHTELTGFDSLLQLVRKQLSGKKFLLVLDDVSNESRTARECFCALIRYVAPGSIILVTSVSIYAAKEVGSNHEHFLRPLLTWDCWLIMKQAMSGKPQFSKEVRAIGLKFAEQCIGSPLAAEIIGGLLRCKQTGQQWKQVWDMEVWKNDEFARDFYSHLYESYQMLSAQLKTCFCYCAVFPKDTYIDIERLIRLLLAVGYLSSDPTSEKLGGYAANHVFSYRCQELNSQKLNNQL